jgi:hypothetical protein
MNSDNAARYNDAPTDDNFTAQLSTLLESYTDRLLATGQTPGVGAEEAVAAQALGEELPPKAQQELAALLALTSQLYAVLTPIEPSAMFITRVKQSLLGEQPATLAVRWRKLPAHYQLAAKLGGAVVTAGLLLLAARRRIAFLRSANSAGRSAGPETGLAKGVS